MLDNKAKSRSLRMLLVMLFIVLVLSVAMVFLMARYGYNDASN